MPVALGPLLECREAAEDMEGLLTGPVRLDFFYCDFLPCRSTGLTGHVPRFELCFI